MFGLNWYTCNFKIFVALFPTAKGRTNFELRDQLMFQQGSIPFTSTPNHRHGSSTPTQHVTAKSRLSSANSSPTGSADEKTLTYIGRDCSALPCRSSSWDHLSSLLTKTITPPQQTQNSCITLIQRRPNVFDVGPTLYKCDTNVLFAGTVLSLTHHHPANTAP